MIDALTLVSEMTDATFADIIKTSPRRIRETLFSRMGIKAKKRIGVKVHAKLEDRSAKLHDALKNAEGEKEEELCRELTRNWLFSKRPLLSDTLDHLGVKHDNGLVEEDPTFFTELELAKVQELVDTLRQKGHPDEWVRIYLAFVETPHLDTVQWNIQ